MPRMKILNSVEREVFAFPPIFNSVERKRQASGFGRNQAPKTDRLNQVPSWEFRNRLKSFTPRQLARILWDFAYLCWANTKNSGEEPPAPIAQLMAERNVVLCPTT